MIYREIVKDLFTVNDDCPDDPYCLGQCISSDFAMAGGIALEFNKYFDMKNRLIKKYGSMERFFQKLGPFALPESIDDFYIYNLVTKYYVWNRPSYLDVKTALEDMAKQMTVRGFHKLSIPRIGCGIDGLDWTIMAPIIQDVFKNTNIEIVVCVQQIENTLSENREDT